MPKGVRNLDGKIEALEAKVEKKQAEIKKLKEQIADLKKKKDQGDNKALFEYMLKNNLTAEDVLGAIKK